MRLTQIRCLCVVAADASASVPAALDASVASAVAPAAVDASVAPAVAVTVTDVHHFSRSLGFCADSAGSNPHDTIRITDRS